jgi:enolase
MSKIKNITCHKIVNSRGDWTLETTVHLDDGTEGVAKVPGGASTGENEANDIPVEKAIEVVSTVLSEALSGEDPSEQEVLDQVMIKMDGTPYKSNLGGNSILSVSLALAVATANSKKMELYEYLYELYRGKPFTPKELKFPTPVFNVLNGGKHANNGLSFQEFMVIPARSVTFERAMEIGVDIYHALERRLAKEGYDVDVGDEGGFAPNGLTVNKALYIIRGAACEKYECGKDIFFGMDVAAGSFYRADKKYHIEEEEKVLMGSELQAFYEELFKQYELIYLEDAFYEKDYPAWEYLNAQFSDRLMVVADDLVVTNGNYLRDAIDKKRANAVIIKPNQVGTLTETLRFVRMAQGADMRTIVSHRSGDTGDTFIADLSLAVGADFIKSGSPVRGERVAKYNRLLDIYSETKAA